MKIVQKLVLIVGIPVAIGALSGGAVYYYIEQSMEERIVAQLESILVLKENQLNDFVEHSMEDIEGLAKDNIFIESEKANEVDDYKNVQQFLKEKLIYSKNFFEFFVLNTNGITYVSTDETQEGKIRLNEAYFIEGKKGSYFQNFYFDEVLREPAKMISTPIKDLKGNLIGVLAGRIDLNKVSDIMTERIGLGDTGETYLVNKFNLLVSKSRLVKGIEFKKIIHTDGVKDCLQGNDGYHYSNYRDDPVLGVHKWISGREVCLITEIGQAEALRPVDRVRDLIILTVIGLMVTIASIGSLLARSISRPINKLEEAARDISKGELDTEIKIESTDEVGDLGKSFNVMVSQLKEQRERDRAISSMKSEFISIVAHQLRTPLSSLKWTFDLMKRGSLGSFTHDQEEYLDGCRKANQEMIDIVNDLLDATKIEEGRFLFDYKKVQVEDLIKEAIQDLEGEAVKKQIEIIFKGLNGLAPFINADAEKLSIAMKNILENAIKYTFKGGKVYVSLEKDTESIIIKIRDTGVGIPKSQQQRIFEKFFRAENALTTETSGTGLGLYIAKNIIEKHGGKIWFTSEENTGTTFTFTIPIIP